MMEKRIRIGFQDIGKTFYEKGLAYTIKAKHSRGKTRYVWKRIPKGDFVRGENIE